MITIKDIEKHLTGIELGNGYTIVLIKQNPFNKFSYDGVISTTRNSGTTYFIEISRELDPFGYIKIKMSTLLIISTASIDIHKAKDRNIFIEHLKMLFKELLVMQTTRTYNTQSLNPF